MLEEKDGNMRKVVATSRTSVTHTGRSAFAIVLLYWGLSIFQLVDGASSSRDHVEAITRGSVVHSVASNDCLANATAADDCAKREGYLMVLLPSSRQLENERVMYEFRVYVQVSVFLALKHVQERSGEILPFLPKRLETCDFNILYKFHDTQFSPLQAGRHVFREGVDGTDRQNFFGDRCESTNSWSTTPVPTTTSSTTESPDTSANTSTSKIPRRTAVPVRSQTYAPIRGDSYRMPISTKHLNEEHSVSYNPFAVIGAARSAVSSVISELGNPFQLPQVSPISTSGALDSSPFFARTIPTSDGESMAIMAYLQSIQVPKCAIFYLKDSWGSSYRHNVVLAARTYDIDVQTIPYTEENIERAMHLLRATKLTYIVGIISPSNWKPVVRIAFDQGMIGNSNYQWYFGSIGALTAEKFTLDLATEIDVAQAIHGAGIVSSTPRENDYQSAHDKAMRDFSLNPALQREFVCQHQSEPEIFDGFEFRPPGPALFHYLVYDAAVALALTACETPGLFTGKEFYDRLLQIDFEGVSGRVQFHNQTGTRLRETLRYRIGNIMLNYTEFSATNSSTTGIPMVSTTAVLVDIPPVTASDLDTAVVEEVLPWIYNDNTTTPPMALPPLGKEMNLIPNGILYFGYIAAALTMFLSIGWGLWTACNRNVYVVRVSQPIFMCQLCLGTFTMSAAVIPLSFQEDMPGLSAACMAVPWLLFVGFTTAFSALFSKTLRINKLLNSGTNFRKIQVEPKDVVQTFLVLMILNMAILTAWTLSPHALHWERIDLKNFDEFGRAVESYGTCQGDNMHAYLVPLAVLNILLLVLATYQSYKARTLPTEFQETEHLFLSMISLSETLMLGIPIVFVVTDHPAAYFFVMSAIVCISCMAILLPVFVPKYWARTAQAGGLNIKLKKTLAANRSNVPTSEDSGAGLKDTNRK